MKTTRGAGRPANKAPSGPPAVMRAGRLALGLTLEEMGSLLGVSQSTVGYWEAGDRSPPASKLREIAKALNVPLEKLIP